MILDLCEKEAAMSAPAIVVDARRKRNVFMQMTIAETKPENVERLIAFPKLEQIQRVGQKHSANAVNVCTCRKC